jgi:hypothetical protein
VRLVHPDDVPAEQIGERATPATNEFLAVADV